MTAPTQAAPPKAGAQPGGQNAPVLAPWPFSVGVLGTQNLSDYDEKRTMGAASLKFPDVKVEPDGWLRGLWFDFDLVTAANVVGAVVFAEDGPFSAIDTVLFRDTGGEQIFGPFGGYDWENTNKFGGYHSIGDPRGDVNFSVTTTGATGGSAHWCFYLPMEVSAADSLGTVENRSENSIYRVEITMAPGTAVYTTPPTTLGTLEIRTTQDSYTEPVAAMALSGRPIATAPPSPGTLQYWKQEDDNLATGSQSTLITNGIGNGYRNIIFKLVRSGSTRANGDADWPDPVEITLGTTRLRNLHKQTWITKMSRAFSLTNATADTARGRENGVFPLWFNRDVGMDPGNEARRGYQRTKTGNTFKVRGTFGGTDTMFISSNYVVPRGNDFSQIVA